MYLVDSDVVTDWLRGRRYAVDLLRNLGRQGICISHMTYGEVYEGIYTGRDPVRAAGLFEQFLLLADVLKPDRSTMHHFARIRGDLRQRGDLIRDPDIIIAATAMQHDLTLMTRNLRHFERISDLRIYDIQRSV